MGVQLSELHFGKEQQRKGVKGMICCLFKVLTLLTLTFSDDIGGRLKALASTKLKVETRQPVNQPTACVRTAHTLRVGFEVPHDSQVGCVA